MTKYDYYALIIALCIAILLLSNGCVSQKKSHTEEQQTNLVIHQKEKAEDVSILEYKIDTTKECDQLITYDITEYYPTIDSSTHQQMVKARKKVNVNTHRTKKGVTSIDSVKVKTDSISLAKDSTYINKVSSEKEREPNSRNLRWWWLILALIATCYIIYKVKK